MELSLDRLRSVPSPLRSVGKTESGNPLFRGLGVVFGGQDFYGDTFDPPREFLAGNDSDVKIGTEYFLREIADEIDEETGELKGALPIPVFWDHGLGSLGTKRLGKAVPVRITKEGIEYLIEYELERAAQYQELVDETYNRSVLGLSSQTLPSFADIDWMSGRIRSWLPGEMTFTVTPAEHRTRNELEQLRSLFRKYGVEYPMKKTAEEQELVPAEEEVTLSETVDSLFDELTEEVAEEEEQVVQNKTYAIVLRALTAFEQRLEAIENQLAKVASADDIEAIRTEIKESRTEYVEATKTMTTRLSDVLKSAVRTKAAELVQDSSEFELQALQSLRGANTPQTPVNRSGYRLPPNAPGQN